MKEFKDDIKDKLEKDGKISKEEVKVELKKPGRKGPTKIASSTKEIPIHYKQAADLMIKHLQDSGVIEEVEHNSQYC